MLKNQKQKANKKDLEIYKILTKFKLWAVGYGIISKLNCKRAGLDPVNAICFVPRTVPFNNSSK